MFGYWVIMCLVVLGLNVGPSTLAWSQNSPPTPDKNKVRPVIDKNQDGSISKEEYLSMWPDKNLGEKSFLWLDQDGKNAENQQYFLPIDQIEKEPRRKNGK
jgi:hypothetical protein